MKNKKCLEAMLNVLVRQVLKKWLLNIIEILLMSQWK